MEANRVARRWLLEWSRAFFSLLSDVLFSFEAWMTQKLRAEGSCSVRRAEWRRHLAAGDSVNIVMRSPYWKAHNMTSGHGNTKKNTGKPSKTQ